MSPGDAIALAALCISALTIYLSVVPTRRELALCKKQRKELRLQLQIVVSAIIGTMNPAARTQLLLELDAAVDTSDEL